MAVGIIALVPIIKPVTLVDSGYENTQGSPQEAPGGDPKSGEVYGGLAVLRLGPALTYGVDFRQGNWSRREECRGYR
jgi:hypothetical protein